MVGRWSRLVILFVLLFWQSAEYSDAQTVRPTKLELGNSLRQRADEFATRVQRARENGARERDVHERAMPGRQSQPSTSGDENRDASARKLHANVARLLSAPARRIPSSANTTSQKTRSGDAVAFPQRVGAAATSNIARLPTNKTARPGKRVPFAKPWVESGTSSQGIQMTLSDQPTTRKWLIDNEFGGRQPASRSGYYEPSTVRQTSFAEPIRQDLHDPFQGSDRLPHPFGEIPAQSDRYRYDPNLPNPFADGSKPNDQQGFPVQPTEAEKTPPMGDGGFRKKQIEGNDSVRDQTIKETMPLGDQFVPELVPYSQHQNEVEQSAEQRDMSDAATNDPFSSENRFQHGEDVDELLGLRRDTGAKAEPLDEVPPQFDPPASLPASSSGIKTHQREEFAIESNLNGDTSDEVALDEIKPPSRLDRSQLESTQELSNELPESALPGYEPLSDARQPHSSIQRDERTEDIRGSRGQSALGVSSQPVRGMTQLPSTSSQSRLSQPSEAEQVAPPLPPKEQYAPPAPVLERNTPQMLGMEQSDSLAHRSQEDIFVVDGNQGTDALSHYQQHMAPANILDIYDGMLADPGGCRSCNSCTSFQAVQCYEPLYYFSLFGGPSSPADFDAFDRNGRELGYDLDTGYGIGFAFGQRQGRNLRTELELSFRDHANDGLVSGSGLGRQAVDLDGNLRTYSGMANTYWEFVNTPTRRIKPYVGAGVGFGVFDASLPAMQSTLNSFDDSGFAYQFMAGLNFKLNQNTDFFGEFRYFNMDGVSVDSNLAALGGPNSSNAKFDFSSRDVFFGFRFKF